jgi:hypothetical protein
LSNGPHTSQNVVEASCRGCLVRGGVGARSRRPVEPASCESECSRGASSAVFWFCCVGALVFRSFLSLIVGTPILLVPTVLDVCCKRSDLDVAYVSHICCNYVSNISAVSVLCYSKCFYLMLYMFYTYVASVCSRCFIHFIWILHSSVSCCTCFMLFGESKGTGSHSGTARELSNDGA